jgi:bacterioferritin
MENTVTNELNVVLKGEFMAMESFEKFIHHIPDLNAKNELKKIQQNHKKHTDQITQRIQTLGGKPSSGVGMSGKVAEIISDIKDITKTDPVFYLQEAYSGEAKGIKMAREIVKGDLDKESMNLIDQILDEDNSHLGTLNGIISSLKNTQH